MEMKSRHFISVKYCENILKILFHPAITSTHGKQISPQVPIISNKFSISFRWSMMIDICNELLQLWCDLVANNIMQSGPIQIHQAHTSMPLEWCECAKNMKRTTKKQPKKQQQRRWRRRQQHEKVHNRSSCELVSCFHGYPSKYIRFSHSSRFFIFTFFVSLHSIQFYGLSHLFGVFHTHIEKKNIQYDRVYSLYLDKWSLSSWNISLSIFRQAITFVDIRLEVLMQKETK